MAVLPEYRNLSRHELDLADHYAETGNIAGLRRMQQLSGSREPDGQRLRTSAAEAIDAGMMPLYRK